MPDFDVTAIDEVIHGRLRLGILSYLSETGVADFATLKAKLKASDGNLSGHVRKLEDAGYVAIAKSFAGRKPQTHVRLTEAGRTAFLAYLAVIENLLAQPAGPGP